jgi:hypothetical protein
MRAIFAAFALAAAGSFMMLPAAGQSQKLKDQLIGTWTLLSWEQKTSDETKVQRYGAVRKVG